MGWQYDDTWKRDIGYGVPAICDHPNCNLEIDRGLSYVCGHGEPYGGDKGCGLYFCEEHGGGWLCPRCRAYKAPYKRPKPDVALWIAQKALDPSWQEWRQENGWPEPEASLIRRFVLMEHEVEPPRDGSLG